VLFVALQNSSHFTSNAVPIKVAFANADIRGPEISVMYKVSCLRHEELIVINKIGSNKNPIYET